MTVIYSYRKFIDADHTLEIKLPEAENGQRIGTELATVDDVTYVSIPDGATLPDQPAEITVETVTLTEGLKADIENASPFVRMIRSMVSDKIAERYSMGDEIKLLRTAPSAEFEAYNAYAEECRAWGREQRAAIGL
ncbi:hypothetical protein [Flavobacterium sp.]|jgi:hypothetical protein|uniref:hypothetical protein n=1 Tax=Flavobacterium sp. TaxID=239 RepID=UPI0037BFC1F3